MTDTPIRKSIMQDMTWELMDMIKSVDSTLWTLKQKVGEYEEHLNEYNGQIMDLGIPMEEYRAKFNAFFDDVYQKVVDFDDYTEAFFNEHYLEKDLHAGKGVKKSIDQIDTCIAILNSELTNEEEEAIEFVMEQDGLMGYGASAMSRWLDEAKDYLNGEYDYGASMRKSAQPIKKGPGAGVTVDEIDYNSYTPSMIDGKAVFTVDTCHIANYDNGTNVPGVSYSGIAGKVIVRDYNEDEDELPTSFILGGGWSRTLVKEGDEFDMDDYDKGKYTFVASQEFAYCIDDLWNYSNEEAIEARVELAYSESESGKVAGWKYCGNYSTSASYDECQQRGNRMNFTDYPPKEQRIRSTVHSSTLWMQD